jgi:hypothetical protein
MSGSKCKPIDFPMMHSLWNFVVVEAILLASLSAHADYTCHITKINIYESVLSYFTYRMVSRHITSFYGPLFIKKDYKVANNNREIRLLRTQRIPQYVGYVLILLYSRKYVLWNCHIWFVLFLLNIFSPSVCMPKPFVSISRRGLTYLLTHGAEPF